MIKILDLIKTLNKNKINFFSGVPDSILKELSIYLNLKNKNNHILSANEGTAVSLGMGYHLATKKLACIYMQNSGLGNAINPLISMAHKKVYSIPMVLLIGWRGSPNSKDEPQHMIKGQITRNLLKLLGIKFVIVNNKKDLKKLDLLIKFSKKNNQPIAGLFKKDCFKKSDLRIRNFNKNKINRQDFIKKFLKTIPKNSKVISTTGFTSRELFQIRNSLNIKSSKDFYMIGGMGHASSVSLGVSLFTKKNIYCLDGDGSLLMHMGSLKTIGDYGKKNIKHILFNNNCHESVGNQETSVDKINFKTLLKSLGYKNYIQLKNENEINKLLNKFIKLKGPSFLEVKISSGSFKKLGRPSKFLKIKRNFIN